MVRRSTVAFVAGLLVLALLRGAIVFSCVLHNIGMVELSRALLTRPAEARLRAATRAEALLRQANREAPCQRSVWRGLGFALAVQGQEIGALTSWKAGGVAAEDLMRLGTWIYENSRPEEALDWYRWAWLRDPDMGDPWYYAGLVYENLQQWHSALDAYKCASTARYLSTVHRSSVYYRVGIVRLWHSRPYLPEEALAAFEAAIEADDFRTNLEAADCHYKRGEILRLQEADVADYLVEFRRAIELDPEHGEAHFRLGIALYESNCDAALAEVELLHARQLMPGNNWVHYHLGELYRQQGRNDEAMAAYERAIELDPQFEAAQKRLAALKEES